MQTNEKAAHPCECRNGEQLFLFKRVQITMENDKKVIIVEGSSDRTRLKRIIREEVDIICTFGSFGVEKFDEMLDEYDLDFRDVYIFVDADPPGEKLRKQLNQELTHAINLYIPDEHVEVEQTPYNILAIELLRHHFDIEPVFLNMDW